MLLAAWVSARRQAEQAAGEFTTRLFKEGCNF
jgi:hypothetical protein